MQGPQGLAVSWRPEPAKFVCGYRACPTIASQAISNFPFGVSGETCQICSLMSTLELNRPTIGFRGGGVESWLVMELTVGYGTYCWLWNLLLWNLRWLVMVGCGSAAALSRGWS